MRSRRSSSVGVLLVLSAFHDVNGLNALSLSPISWMRALAAASSCLSVVISAAAAAVRGLYRARISAAVVITISRFYDGLGPWKPSLLGGAI